MPAGFVLKEFETSRLRLRQLLADDARQLVLLRNDERVNHYLDRPKSTSYEQAVGFIERVLSNSAYYWAINLKHETKLIGTICFWNPDAVQSTIEIGYELLPDFQGQGLLAEALRAVINFNSTDLQFGTIIGITHTDNTASIKLLERNGFKRDPLREDNFHKEGGSPNERLYSLKPHNPTSI